MLTSTITQGTRFFSAVDDRLVTGAEDFAVFLGSDIRHLLSDPKFVMIWTRSQ